MYNDVPRRIDTQIIKKVGKYFFGTTIFIDIFKSMKINAKIIILSSGSCVSLKSPNIDNLDNPNNPHNLFLKNM